MENHLAVANREILDCGRLGKTIGPKFLELVSSVILLIKVDMHYLRIEIPGLGINDFDVHSGNIEKI